MSKNKPRGCFFGFLNFLIFGDQADDSNDFPFSKIDSLLTPAERRFHATLVTLVPEGHYLFTKVRLADLIAVRKGTEKRQSFFNRIKAKHVDFVVCDAEMSPWIVIELDDRSHQREDRKARDQFVDNAMKAAGIPILHVKAARSYDAAILADSINAITS